MFWQEDEDKTLPWQAPDDVLDLSFAMRCRRLPQDHSWALSAAIREHLPWIGQDQNSGIHSIHVAGSSNGWLRPDAGSEQFLIPSRRTRLLLRVQKTQLVASHELSGETLNIDDCTLTVGDNKEKPLLNAAVVFARYVLSDENETEAMFLQRMADEIKAVAACKVKKMLCGKNHYINTPDGPQLTRHLMIADLDNSASIRLQQYGLGGGRAYGCGLFLPHKGIKTLNPTE